MPKKGVKGIKGIKEKEMKEVIVCDLDGTLIRNDISYEAIISFLHQKPFKIGSLIGVLILSFFRGRQYMKSFLQRHTFFDSKHLPYHQGVLDYLSSKKEQGHKLVLATASNIHLARRVNEHLSSLFDDVLGSTEKNNLKGHEKAKQLKQRYGLNYIYLGDARVDNAIWDQAKGAVVVGASTKVLHHREKLLKHIACKKQTFKSFLKSFRTHRWLKNFLIFIPSILSLDILSASIFYTTFLGFVSFCLIASSIYVFNDVLDVHSDRRHPRKKNRPIARGDLQVAPALTMACFLAMVALSLSFSLSWPFFLCLLAYVLANIFYSFYFKKILIVDVFVLTALFLLRIYSGNVLGSIEISYWLILFCLYLFLGLALLKRYCELIENKASSFSGKAYLSEDCKPIYLFGIFSHFSAVFAFPFYIHSHRVQQVYATPELLWGIFICLLIWVNILWVQVYRGRITNDPISFIVKDKASCIILFISLLLFVAAKKLAF